jgi:hypothetical protein
MNRPLTFEDQVLAYLDDDLDRQASDNLMRQVSCDPEKQRLLDAHKRLREMLQASHPEVKPTNSEQIELALRLPILQQVINVTQSAKDVTAEASAFISWRTVISAFDISMMILAIIGLGIALTSSALVPVSLETSNSVADNVPFLQVALRSAKLDLLANSEIRPDEFVQAMHSQDANKRIDGGAAVACSIDNRVTLLDPIIRTDAEVESILPLSSDGTMEATADDFSSVDPRSCSSIVTYRNSHGTFVAIEPVVLDDATFKPHLSLYGGMSTNSRMYGSLDAVQAASPLSDGGSIGFGYEVTPGVEIGFDLGYMKHPGLRYDRVGDTILGTTQVTKYTSQATIQDFAGLTPKAFAAIAIASSMGFDFHLMIEGGEALLDNPSPTAAVGFKGRCNISDNVSFVGSVLLNASYVKSEGLSSPTFNGLPVDRSHEQRYLLTPGVLAGISLQYYIF